MTWYTTYNNAMAALKTELEAVTLSAYDDMKFEHVEFGPWEQLKATPCCQILESGCEKMIVSMGQSYQQVELTVALHIFHAHPWERTRGGTLTAREAVLKTAGDVWDYFMKGTAKTLTSTVQDCVPVRVIPWDLDQDWNAYHSIIELSIRVVIAGV